MEKKIWFDMDGTFIDLYGVENWLEQLRAENPRPYKVAKPKINMSAFAKILKKLQAEGYEINIVSWTSKNGSEVYNKRVARTKKEYLAKHLPSVKFNEIQILEYGTPKSCVGNGILFDDEINNRDNWKGIACSEKNLLKKLNCLLTK